MWGVAQLMRRPVAAAGWALRGYRPRSLQVTARRAFAEQPALKQAAKPTAEAEAASKQTAETAKSQAKAATTATELLKAKKQRTKMIIGGLAVTSIGAALIHYEDILQWQNDMWKLYTTPVMQNLLPPLIPEQQAIKTLVLDLEETLVHFEYDRSSGWRCLKRPYVDAFLDYLSLGGLYEVVIFSNGYSYAVDPFLDKIDPMVMTSRGIQCRLQHRLAREHGKLEGNHWIKPLDSLNRNLAHVVVVDKEGDAEWQPQGENCIGIKPFDGDMDDTELLKLIPVLESMALPDVPDVRSVIKQHKESELGLVESFTIAQRKKRDQIRNYSKGRSLFGGQGQHAGMPPIGASPAELEKGEVMMPLLNISVQDPRMSPQTEEDISRQMKESVDMQVEEFKDIESPLGFKIPKIPGSTDDLSALIGLTDSSNEDSGELPSLEDFGKQAGAGATGARGQEQPPAPAPQNVGGGMFGGGLFGSRRQQ